MTGSPRREDDPELEDIGGLRRDAAGGRVGLGWVIAALIVLSVGLGLWAYLR